MLAGKRVVIGTGCSRPGRSAATACAVLLGKSRSMPYVWLPRGEGLATLRGADGREAHPVAKHAWWNCLTQQKVRAHSSVGRAADS